MVDTSLDLAPGMPMKSTPHQVDAGCRATLGHEDQVDAAHDIQTPKDADDIDTPRDAPPEVTQEPPAKPPPGKLRRAWSAQQFSPKEEADLEATPQAEWKRCGECLQMQPLELFSAVQWQRRGYKTCYVCQAPTLHGCQKLRRAGKARQFSPEQEPDLHALQRADGGASQFVAVVDAGEASFQRVPKTEELLQQVRDLDRYPMEFKCDIVEGHLARMPRRLAPPLCDPVWQDGYLLYVEDAFDPRGLTERVFRVTSCPRIKAQHVYK